MQTPKYKSVGAGICGVERMTFGEELSETTFEVRNGFVRMSDRGMFTAWGLEKTFTLPHEIRSSTIDILINMPDATEVTTWITKKSIIGVLRPPDIVWRRDFRGAKTYTHKEDITSILRPLEGTAIFLSIIASTPIGKEPLGPASGRATLRILTPKPVVRWWW